MERFCNLFRSDFFLPKLWQRIVDAGLEGMLPKPDGVDDLRYYIWEMSEDGLSATFKTDRAIEVFRKIGVVKSPITARENMLNPFLIAVVILIAAFVWKYFFVTN